MKYFIKRIKFIFIICLSPFCLLAQDSDHHDHDHDHGHHHKHELGMANAPVYFVREKEWAYGLHLHYVYNIGESPFGVGLGYERIFDEHKHNTVGVVVGYRPIDPLLFNVAPGVTFEGKAEEGFAFALHLEATYEFFIGDFHVGPVAEFAYDPEDLHLSFGIHIGYGF